MKRLAVFELPQVLFLSLSHLDSSGLLSSGGSRSGRGSDWDAADEGGEVSVGGGHVLDGRGSHGGLGEQLGGGRNTNRGDGVSVDLGHSVCVDLGHGVGHWGSLDLHGLCSLNSNWGSGVNTGNVVGSPHSSNWGNTNIGSRNQVGNCVGNGSSHNSLADGINKAILVQIFGKALEGKGAKALGGLDCVSEGRSEGADWNTRVDMGGGGGKAAGKERRQDKGLHSDSLGW